MGAVCSVSSALPVARTTFSTSGMVDIFWAISEAIRLDSSKEDSGGSRISTNSEDSSISGINSDPILKDKKTNKVYCASCEREIQFADTEDDIQHINAKRKTDNIYQRLDDILIRELEQLLPLLVDVDKKQTADYYNTLLVVEKIIDIQKKLPKPSKN